MIETNCTGLVYVTRAVLPQMVARGRGHVVNLGSIAGTYPYPGGNVYGATKAFVHQFSLNLRSDLHGTGVRVTSVEPGLSGGTEFSDVRFGGDSERAAAVYAGTQGRRDKESGRAPPSPSAAVPAPPPYYSSSFQAAAPV
jgi:3-hydroxy acid dehydrogenase / malonic semialdehyde reductase